ncbi:MAG: glycosyltransferase family 2 protein [Phycisphaerae bacterium]|nr:glycosyltransferase family 2 protein [Phycisphaerae bacterium]
MSNPEKSKFTVTAVVPAYNAEKHIARAIDSILKQTRPADEIIVVDDGSTDATAEVVKAYGDKVRYIYQANSGVSVARNKGIEAASGNWIAFLDGDDEWCGEKLRLQTEHLLRNDNLKWTYSNFYLDRPGGEKPAQAHDSEALANLLGWREFFDDYLQAYVNHGHAWTCTLMIRRDVFDKTGLFEPGMKRAQDNDLWFRIAYQYPKVGYLAEPLAVYHTDTPGSSTKTNDEVDHMLYLIDRQLKISAQFGRQQELKPCITSMLGSRIRQFVNQKRYADVKILLDNFNEYLPRRFQREINFRLIFPPLSNCMADMILKLKGFIKSK